MKPFIEREPMKQSNETQRMIEKIRTAMAQCNASEREVYEALCDEATGWQMRLEELEDEDE